MSVNPLAFETIRTYPYASRAERAEEQVHQDSAAQTTVLGFWIYLMSDCILFAALFATFSVLGREFAGGPTGRDLFSLPYVLVETLCLLVSSFTYGMAILGLNTFKRGDVLKWLAVTFLLGLCFIGLEVKEFVRLVSEGAGPDRSAFLSSFFALVGTHGLHVTGGLIWMAVMAVQVGLKGLKASVSVSLLCLSLFWHFLDIVWIGVFTVVYLMGSL